MDKPATHFWEQLVRITGTDDPSYIAYFTGIGYPQMTKYRKGTAGVRGPNAASMATIVENLRARAGIEVTMCQLWGVEPLPERLGVDMDAVRMASLVKRTEALRDDSPEGSPPSSRSTRQSDRSQGRKD